MKTIKRFIYVMRLRHYNNAIITYMDGFEQAKLDGDVDGMGYWDGLIARCIDKIDACADKLAKLSIRK